jgi:site-specific recombinase XerD
MIMRNRKNIRRYIMGNIDLRLPELIRHFDTYNRTDGKSPATQFWYKQHLGAFLDWLIENGRSVNLGAIDEKTVREYILWYREKRVRDHVINVASVHARVRALRAFFNWLYHQGYTETHLLQDVRPPRLPKVMVDTLSDDEIARILTTQDKFTVTGSRNIAILSVFLDVGLRLAELVNLPEPDVHLEEQYVKVMGKGAKERMVAFGTTTRNNLLSYYLHFRGEPAHPGVNNFFLTIDGYPLDKEAVKSLLNRIGKAAGVPRLHAHLCRHTYATNFLVNGGNVLLLKQNLGHTTLTMVDHYVHLATSRVAILSREFSPLDKLGLRGMRRGENRARNRYEKGTRIFKRRS